MAEVRISPQGGQDAQVALDVGEVLAVELPENPTTGYVWSVGELPAVLAELPPDPAAEHAAGQEQEPRPGAAGRRVLRFAARAPGGGKLTFRHGRPWQPDSAEEVVVAVEVETAS